MIISLSRTGIIFIQMLRSMIFLSNKGLIQRWRQCTKWSSFVKYFFVWNQYQHDSQKIIRFFTSSIASMLLNYCLGRGSGKSSILSIFSRLGLFLQFFGQVKERLTLDLNEMIRLSYAVACPIGFTLLCDFVLHGRMLKLMKNDHF